MKLSNSLLFENPHRDISREKEILREMDALSAYDYVILRIKKRWPEAEEFIKKDTDVAYWYARDVIKGRWPEAENAIKKNPRHAYFYALRIIKDRWPEAEEIIKMYPEVAFEYAIDVMKKRWPEAEKCIKRDGYYWEIYIDQICRQCDGYGLIDYGIGGATEECSQCNGGGLDLSSKNQSS